jgi:hypothetical protein
MHKSLTVLLLTTLVVCAVLWAPCAATAGMALTAELDSFQEVPPHNTPGYGSADATLNGTTFTITSGSYADLTGNSSSIILADAAVGSNGTTIGLLSLGNSIGATSGTFSGSITLTGAQVTDMLAGNTYINLRTNVFPSGEIRVDPRVGRHGRGLGACRAPPQSLSRSWRVTRWAGRPADRFKPQS